MTGSSPRSASATHPLAFMREAVVRAYAVILQQPPHYFIPVAIVLALWLPGITQGWLRTDSHYYAAIGLDAWNNFPVESPGVYNSKAAPLDLRLGELPYHNKPPLAFWIHGLFLQFASPGRSDASVMFFARLPALLAAIVALVLWIRTVKLLAGPRLALIAGITLALTVEFFRYTRAISLDLHLAWTITLALMLAASALARDKPHRLIFAGIGIGLGLLVKPGVALLLVPAITLWIAWAYGKTSLTRFAIPLAAMTLVALLIAGPWYAWMHLKFPGQFFDTIAIEQTAERFKASNARPWFYYFTLLAETYAPMLICLIGAIVAWLRRVPAGPAKPILTLAIVIGISWLTIISLASDKHGRYMMPSLIAFSAIAAWWIDLAFIQPRLARAGNASPNKPPRRRTHWFIVAMGIIIALLVNLLSIEVHPPRDPRWQKLADAAGLRKPTPADTVPLNTIFADRSAMFPYANLRMMGYQWPFLLEANPSMPHAPGDLLFSRRSAIDGYQRLPESFNELGLFRKLPAP